jgi:PAS domain S-box-containing protein
MSNPNPKRSSTPTFSDARRDASAAGVEQAELPRVDKSTALYKLLVDSVRDYAIFALDQTGRIITWNLGAERLKGYAPHEIIGKHFSVFYTPEDQKARKPDNELAIATVEGRVEDESWRVRKDGSRFWANVVITALRNADGGLVGFAKVTRDLTERRATEETLRLSEERFRLLIQGVRDYGIFMLDPEGHVASWNEGAQRINGYTASEILGKHFSVFYPEESLARKLPDYELEVAARDGSFEDEGWRVRKDGSEFWSNVIITAMRDASGRLIGFSKVTRDLTERRASQERAIEDARRIAEAEVANKTKSAFLASMSHELRTPLNAIGGYADLLLFGVGGSLMGEQREYLDRLRRSQQHLLGIINDLLNFSRIEAGRITYDMQLMSLGRAIHAVLPMVEPQAAQRGLDIRVEATPDCHAMGDPAKVEQILLNLLSNAIKFTDRGGSIVIEQFVLDDAAGIRVTDTGIGIPDDKLQSIFEPFVQVGRTLTTAHEGTGLGLAISRDLARAMNGDITVRSVLETGSVFELALKKG